MKIPDWPQLVALKIPEMKEEFNRLSAAGNYDRFKPDFTMFDGKSNVLELRFLDKSWDQSSAATKLACLDYFEEGMHNKFGEWVMEVREFGTGIGF